MASTRQTPNQAADGEAHMAPQPPDDGEPETIDASNELLKELVERIHKRAEGWRDALTVSIGRARELTNLEETRIRYFEELGALQPTKLAGGAGSNRLYTLADLRCLYALAILVKEHDYRPQAAALLVKHHRDLIVSGRPDSLHTLVEREGDVVTDGFVLARLMSQLLDAVQAEFAPGCGSQASPTAPAGASAPSLRVVGVLLSLQKMFFDSRGPAPAVVQRMGRAICKRPKDTLIALDRAAFFGTDARAARFASQQTSVRNDSTILLYSRDDAWDIPLQKHHRFCFYTSSQQQLSMWLILEGAAEMTPASPLLFSPQRRTLVDRVLSMCAQIFQSFRDSSLAKNYRYRSDGFQIEHSQKTYSALLKLIVDLIFSDPNDSVAALLIPNSLEHPTTLAMLANHNYADELVSRVKLDLHGEGQGLCGRAYNVREPFFSANTRSDPRVAYALEEHSQVALAIPLVMSGVVAPLGVLYLASQKSQPALRSDDAYFALILGNILSEQLGRWWLTRLRKTHDQTLHEQMEPITRWFDSLNPHGRDFQEAIDELQKLWLTIHADDTDADTSNVALLLFDIDSYRQNVQVRSTDPVPLEAQMHVRKAILKILPNTRDYWFKHDHVLVIVHNYKVEQVIAFARRIANQVRAVPLSIQGADGKNITLSVSGAIKMMSYRDLHDLDAIGQAQFRHQIEVVLDDLREQTAHSTAHSLQILKPEGWTPA